MGVKQPKKRICATQGRGVYAGVLRRGMRRCLGCILITVSFVLSACAPVTGTAEPTSTPFPPAVTLTPVPPSPTPRNALPHLTADDFDGPTFAPPLQQYLDAGGDPAQLEAALDAIIAVPAEGARIRAWVDRVDVTGDGVDDIAVALAVPRGGAIVDTGLVVLAHQDERYVPILDWIRAPVETLTDADGYRFLDIVDMNRSGVKDMVVVFAMGSQHRFWILEWDGTAVRSLLAPQRDPLTLETVDYVTVPNGTGLIRDVNGDGLLELYTIRYRPPDEGLRHCGAKDVFAWDGTVFRLWHRTL